MKVLALIEAADHVCYRYRIEPFAWTMAERGLFLEAMPLEAGNVSLGSDNCGRPVGPTW